MLVALAAQVMRVNAALDLPEEDGRYTLTLDRASYRAAFSDSAEGVVVSVQGRSGGEAELGLDAARWQAGKRVYACDLAGRLLVLQAVKKDLCWTVSHGGRSVAVTPMRAEVAALYHYMPEKVVLDTSRIVVSPMPGLLKSIAVSVGQSVKSGETLAVVEAMKMENLLTAAVDGVIETIPATVGGTLKRDEVILTLS